MALWQALNDNWQLFRCSVPGRRFQDWYWHRCRRRYGSNSRARRWLYRLAGGLVMTAGVVMLATPGPGWGFIGLGAAFLAGESLAVARTLDSMELRLRGRLRQAARAWAEATPLARSAVIVGMAVILCAPAYGLYLLLGE